MASDLIHDLARCPLFGSLAAPELERIARSCRRVEAPSGGLIFREGEPFQGIYVLLAGCVRVFKIGPDGRERILHIIRPPSSFAEAVLFIGGPYPAFAAAIEDSRLILVRPEPIIALIREEPEASLRMLESLSRWIHRLLGQLENETFLNTRAKLAHFLLREARRLGCGQGSYRFDLTVPKKDIASQLGMVPESFSRAQADLEARGLLKVSGKHVEIPDPASLEELLLSGGD
jgi:CRP/FNR family transcriptional regulator